VPHPIPLFLFSALASAPLMGCWSARPGDSGRLAAPRIDVAAAHWPEREVKTLQPLLSDTPDRVYRYRLADGANTSALSPADIDALKAAVVDVSDKGIFGLGLVRLFRPPDPENPAYLGPDLGFEPNATVLTSRGWNDEAAVRARETVRRSRAAYNNAVGPDAALHLTGQVDEIGLWSGVPMRIPAPAPGSNPRGVILHYHSIAPNPFESAALAKFESRGWLLINIATFATVRGEHRPGTDEEIARVRSAQAAMEARIYAEVRRTPYKTYQRRCEEHPAGVRLAQLDRQEFELRRLTFQACKDADLSTVGANIALQVDQQLAGNAYVGESALEYLYARHPGLKTLPLVVIGFSGGALAAPAAVARLGQRVDAMILIGGGANIFRLAQDSSLTDGGITIRCGKDTVPRSTIDAIEAAYLSHTKLDPWTLAPMLGGVPVLHVYGTWDRMVPTSAANRLNDRLGTPDRLALRGGGHTLLFYRIDGRADDMADWLDDQLNPDSSASHP